MEDQDNKGKKKQDLKTAIEEIRILIAKGDIENAEKKLALLRKDSEESAAILNLRGLIYQAKNEFQIAKEYFEEAIKVDVNYSEAYISLTNFYESQNKIDEGAEVLFKGARESDEPLMFYRWIESFSNYRGRPDIAHRAIAEVKERYKNRPELDYKMGEAAYNLGLYALAVDYFRKCINNKFDGEFTYFLLAQCMMFLGHHRYMSHFLRKAILKGPTHVGAYEALIEYLSHYDKSQDAQLIAGLKQQVAPLTGDVAPVIYLKYFYDSPDADKDLMDELCDFLEIEPEEFKALGDDGYKHIEIGESIEFQAFADVNIELLMIENRGNSLYSIVSALSECIAALRKDDMNEFADYYEGWLAVAQNNIPKALTIFNLLNSQPHQDIELKNRIMSSIAYLENTRPPSGDYGSKEKIYNYGFMLNWGSEKLAVLEMTGLNEYVSRMMEVLQQDSHRSILLTGPSGVGKTAAIYLLDRQFNKSNCPEKLKGFRIFQVSTSSIVAGAKYIGEWQKNITELCEECSLKNKIILYFEDIENIFGVGQTIGDKSNFSDYLLPRMENGDIVVICEMHDRQAAKLLTAQPKFERIMSRIEINEPTDEILLKSLSRIATTIGKDKNLSFAPSAIDEVIDLNKIFLPYRAFPGKGIDLIRRTAETFSKKKEKTQRQIDVDEIILAFCEMTGIPDFIIDKNQVLDFGQTRNFFTGRVLGQEEALDSIINAVTTFKARLSEYNKPIKSFLFVGPTGVGKTESAKVLAEYLFGSKERIIRLNMSEYSEPDSVSKLLGRNYYDEKRSSRFLEAVRKEPFSIILLDEIEKAHPLVFNLLLQLLDEGMLQDSSESPVFFQSSIIIMTSNIGARHYTLRSIGFGEESKISGIQEAVLSEVKEFFSPEIYNRFDEVICFKPLGMDVLDKIINREIGKVFERRGIAALGCAVDIEHSIKEHIIKTGYDPKYGARHIKRAVEKSVALPLARLLASTYLKGGDLISIGMSAGSPSAQLVEEKEIPAEDYRHPSSETDMLNELTIPGKGLKNMIESLEGRVNSLKKRFDYQKVSEEKDNLHQLMAQPDFWDDHKKANKIVRRFADLNKKTDRIRKWESLFDKIKATARIPGAKLSKPEIAQTKSQLFGLLKELESAELEVLLEGKHDYADAFIVLSCSDDSEENVRWLLEMTGVYSKWARRRGYIYKHFGEDAGNGSGKASIFMHIGGLNAYGLLKNESGIHRKVFLRQPPRGPQVVLHTPKSEYDCNVLVLPDIDYGQDDDEYYSMKMTRLKSSMPGIKIRSLQYRVALKHIKDNVSLQFCSDNTVQDDRSIATDLFRAYLKNIREVSLRGEEPKPNAAPEPVRTYEIGDRNRVIDHRSRIIIQNPKDYLNGKIDSLLLERIL